MSVLEELCKLYVIHVSDFDIMTIYTYHVHAHTMSEHNSIFMYCLLVSLGSKSKFEDANRELAPTNDSYFID